MKQLTFLILSTTDWDAPQFGSRQQIARQLVRRGHRVIFVDVPRALHSFISDPAGTRRALGYMGRVRQIPDAPLLYTPWPVLPIYYNPLTNAINQRLMLRYLRRLLAHLGYEVDVLWSYWPNTSYLIGRLGEKVAVYHCIDDFVAVGYPLTTRSAIANMEAEQCRRVNLIFTRTKGLAEAKRQFNPNIHLLPGGVDTTHFDPATVSKPPPEIVALPTPRIGFVGTIDDRVDIELLRYCASNLPETIFIFVGPVKRHRVNIAPLQALPNVYFLPACSHSEVPAIVSAFDVCLIPYLINDYTKGLSPIKLYEYMAMGKSVVAVDLPYLHREAEYITITTDYEQFALAIAGALANSFTVDEQVSCRNAAGLHSWEKQAIYIEEVLVSFDVGV